MVVVNAANFLIKQKKLVINVMLVKKRKKTVKSFAKVLFCFV